MNLVKSAYIITMHCPLNYGAILQTYALQTYLESLDIETKVIDYRPHYIIHNQSLMYVGNQRFKKSFFMRWAYRIVKAPTKYKRIKAFERFAKNELHLTSTYFTYNDIKSANLDAEVFICGSDQIWNVISGAHKDPAYFLGFVPDHRKKISYAASGNIPLTDEVKTTTIKMINRIDHISMRENSTITTIQPYVKNPITHVCDPVFLLRDNDWRTLYKKHSTFQPKEKYVLVYPMGNGIETTIKNAILLANQLHLPVYKISASQRKDTQISKRFNINPYDFLALLDNAEAVVTNSFHGISFSIIFKKQFWACVAEGSNQRISSLLNKAGIPDRLLIDDRTPDITSFIDYKLTNNSLKTYITQSKNFIQDSVKA